jgi:hypothetical protein
LELGEGGIILGVSSGGALPGSGLAPDLAYKFHGLFVGSASDSYALGTVSAVSISSHERQFFNLSLKDWFVLKILLINYER